VRCNLQQSATKCNSLLALSLGVRSLTISASIEVLRGHWIVAGAPYHLCPVHGRETPEVSLLSKLWGEDASGVMRDSRRNEKPSTTKSTKDAKNPFPLLPAFVLFVSFVV
jgi:hypothetical protein